MVFEDRDRRAAEDLVQGFVNAQRALGITLEPPFKIQVKGNRANDFITEMKAQEVCNDYSKIVVVLVPHEQEK